MRMNWKMAECVLQNNLLAAWGRGLGRGVKMELLFRHSRESGNPFLFFRKFNMDSRFRGNDGAWKLNLNNFIIPNWPAPANVHALQTNRHGGCSYSPYDSFNLGSHVKDNPIHVAQNRQLLTQFLPSEPVWLNQIHGVNVVNAAQTDCLPDADASFTNRKNVVCVTMTADCLPILVCDTAGTVIASIHAGDRKSVV